MKHYLKWQRIMLGFGLQSIEPIDMIIVLAISISIERKMPVAEPFIQRLATEYGKHPVRTDSRGLGIRKPVNS